MEYEFIWKGEYDNASKVLKMEKSCLMMWIAACCAIGRRSLL